MSNMEQLKQVVTDLLSCNMETELCDIDLMQCNVELMRCTGAEKAASTIVFMSKVSEMNDVEQLRQLVMHIMKGTIRYISNILRWMTWSS